MLTVQKDLGCGFSPWVTAAPPHEKEEPWKTGTPVTFPLSPIPNSAWHMVTALHIFGGEERAVKAGGTS